MPYLTNTPFYTTIIDPEGAINMADNSFAPVSHRVYCDQRGFQGYESLRKLFKFDDKELIKFLILTLEQQSGSYGRLTWERK